MDTKVLHELKTELDNGKHLSVSMKERGILDEFKDYRAALVKEYGKSDIFPKLQSTVPDPDFIASIALESAKNRLVVMLRAGKTNIDAVAKEIEALREEVSSWKTAGLPSEAGGPVDRLTHNSNRLANRCKQIKTSYEAATKWIVELGSPEQKVLLSAQQSSVEQDKSISSCKKNTSRQKIIDVWKNINKV